jgi:site-specific DNA recombinase
VISPGVLAWLQEAVLESDLNERGAREREVKRLEEQHRRVQTKLEAIYEDRLEGRISKELYDRKAHDLRTQSLELLSRMNEMRVSAPASVQEAIDLMDLTSRAADLFLKQPTSEKQRFLKLVLKSARWQDGRLCTEFEIPFESLRCSNQLSRTKHQGNGAAVAEIEDWLPK